MVPESGKGYKSIRYKVAIKVIQTSRDEIKGGKVAESIKEFARKLACEVYTASG